MSAKAPTNAANNASPELTSTRNALEAVGDAEPDSLFLFTMVAAAAVVVGCAGALVA